MAPWYPYILSSTIQFGTSAYLTDVGNILISLLECLHDITYFKLMHKDEDEVLKLITVHRLEW